MIVIFGATGTIGSQVVRHLAEQAPVRALAGSGVPLVKLAALGFDAVPVDQAIALGANHARVVSAGDDGVAWVDPGDVGAVAAHP